ncbi:MAG TPA: hypothetical protein GX526_06660 [Thermoanaerobacterales bacterium]|nr:hypothetical protein [Thermoanaerobacterales bacterium]
MKILMKPIEMIAYFKEEGIPKPIRFRTSSANGLHRVIKVDKIITKTQEKLAGNNMYVFRCQSCINGMEKMYELKYELSTCKWFLFKI